MSTNTINKSYSFWHIGPPQKYYDVYMRIKRKKGERHINYYHQQHPGLSPKITKLTIDFSHKNQHLPYYYNKKKWLTCTVRYDD